MIRMFLCLFFNFQEKRLSNVAHAEKQRRTNFILFSISVIFFVRSVLTRLSHYNQHFHTSWPPFSLFCITTDTLDVFENTSKQLPFTLLGLAGSMDQIEHGFGLETMSCRLGKVFNHFVWYMFQEKINISSQKLILQLKKISYHYHRNYHIISKMIFII